MIDWNKYFDKIFCLNLSENTDRYEAMKKEFARVGIDIHSDYFEWKITVRNPFYEHMYENPKCPILRETWFRIHHKNCTMAHYEIFRESLDRGYNRVLILEDDARFLKDLDKLEEVLEHMPQDFDICLFDGYTFNKELYQDLLENHKVNDYYISYEKTFSSCGCYSLSKKGMEFLLKNQETLFLPADFYINKGYTNIEDDLIRIKPINNISVQDFSYKTYTNTNDIWRDFNTWYKIVDVNDYNITNKDNVPKGVIIEKE